MLALFRTIFAPPRDLILLLAAVWVGWSLSEKRAARHNLRPNVIGNLIFTSLLAYVLGGRIIFAFEHLNAFTQSPISLLSLNSAAFDSWAAVATAGLAGLIYAQRAGLLLWRTLDGLTTLFASIAVGEGFSHLASGAAFGGETSAPWAIYLWGAMRQPTQLYEIVASVLIFVVVWFRRPDGIAGTEFLIFAALTALSRLFIETFRGDSTLIFGGFRAAQIVAWAVLASALLGLEALRQRAMPTDRVFEKSDKVEPANGPRHRAPKQAKPGTSRQAGTSPTALGKQNTRRKK